MGCISKFTLFVTNFIVFAVGVAVVALASMVISKDNTYGVLLSEGTFSLPIIILIAGLIILLIGFLGCCGAVQESPCLLYTYAGIVLILLLAQLILGILILVYSNKAEEIIVKGMKEVFDDYGRNDTSLTKAIDQAQHDLKCCGVQNYTDWEDFYYGQQHENNSVADGCCKGNTTVVGCGLGVLDDPDVETKIYTQGCFYAIQEDAKDATVGLGVACLILALVEGFSISFACSLAKGAR
ncbi:CD63 antigen-like [Macrobrachium nipponense]|uniref:CD63 antigen-like n=1 Tax=Macrobrachium nipponense TaxID=159736 RepID=UPI0030C87A5D